ncbi:UNVERIFIED_CONTAM: Retrovirus-related Pol polyprotein from transposon.6 [Sesamum calycinum]|uniref:Retrovirus-related Pol polyprotein from transposon.6 n=1 Tax=Sesamum calycinum TaxID=2727403 RepID=A0AAW2MPW7_9LAMI
MSPDQRTIIRSPDWNASYKIICDASNYAVGVVLGQRIEKTHHMIYYASKTLDAAQCNYSTTEKELLAIIFALDKFRSYLLGSKIVVFFGVQSHNQRPQGSENLIADHLRRLLREEDDTPICDNFLGERIFKILLAVDYVSKWAKAKATLTDDSVVVIAPPHRSATAAAASVTNPRRRHLALRLFLSRPHHRVVVVVSSSSPWCNPDLQAPVFHQYCTAPPPAPSPVQPLLPAPSVAVHELSPNEPLRHTYRKRARFNSSTGIPPTAERELEGCLTFTFWEHKKKYSVIKT